MNYAGINYSRFFKGLKNQAAKFFFQNKEHESQMKNLLKQIKKEKMVRLLNKIVSSKKTID